MHTARLSNKTIFLDEHSEVTNHSRTMIMLRAYTCILPIEKDKQAVDSISHTLHGRLPLTHLCAFNLHVLGLLLYTSYVR